MDFLNQIAKQVSDLFASMTPGARLTAGLLVAVVVASLGFLFQQSTAGPDEFLFGGEPLTSAEINAMTAAMSQAGLNEFDVQGAHIKVPRGTRNAYIAAVADAGALPTHAKDFMLKALDQGSVFDTREVKNQRMKLAVEQEFSHIIGWFPWVQQASVIYDLKSVRGPRAVERASATVSVLPKPGEELDERRARNIRKLVAGGFTSMTVDDVTVNNMGDDSFASFGGDADPGVYESPYHRERARVENEVRRDILSQLAYIPGVRVQVSAELDKVMQQQVNESTPDSPVAVMEESNTEDTQDRVVDNGARPGQQVNTARGPNSAEGPQRETTKTAKSEKSITSSVVGTTTTQTLYAGMPAKEIQASIEVPRNYVLAVWRQQQEQLTGEVPDQIDQTTMDRYSEQVIETITNAVKPLLPKLVRESDYEQVNVTIIDTMAPAPMPEPSVASNAAAWAFQNSSMLVMVGVALFSVVMLRSLVKAPPGEDDGGSPLLQLDPNSHADATAGPGDDEQGEDGRPKLTLRKAESLKDDLSEIVKSDPDAAAAILRGWIGNAG